MECAAGKSKIISIHKEVEQTSYKNKRGELPGDSFS